METPEITFIMRSDEMIRDFDLKRVTVNTSHGPVDRCFIGKVFNTNIAVIYGRFKERKTTADLIDFEQNIEVVKNLGCKKLVGTFVVGGISPERPAGTVYVLKDLIGMGGYRITMPEQEDFHNAEMFRPFCEKLTEQLKTAARVIHSDAVLEATYVCFHGWPRIETSAELAFYNKMGWDIVGQTCDPEATIARIYGICYAGIAVQIDDPASRGEATDPKLKTNDNTLTIKEYRKKTTSVVLQMLREYHSFSCSQCEMAKRTNRSFRKLPDWYYE